MSVIKALIDLGAFRHNYETVRQITGADTAILPVLKADAYGHGVLPLAREALKAGSPAICIGTVDEGTELRKAKIAAPIIVLDGFLEEEVPEILKRRLTPVVFSVDMAELLNNAAKKDGKTLTVHIKFDTGMSRLGIPFTVAGESVKRIEKLKKIKVEGIMTHLASSTDANSPQTEFQISRFDKIIGMVKNSKLSPKWIHSANSGGILNFPSSHYNSVRPGIMLYGILPAPIKNKKIELKPVMTLTSRIISVKTLPSGEGVGYNATYITPRTKRIGVVMGGYADGVKRLLSNQGSVLWENKTLPIVGNICMDNFMIDLSRAPNAVQGDEVILLGPQHEKISGQSWAEMATTIPYEIFCDIGRRVERIAK
jgi:alanine racemase